MAAVILIDSETLGRGDDALGAVLMRAFLKNLVEADPLPARLLFLNGGARLTTEGSPHLETLRALADRGVEILTCGTCLDWYGLKDKLLVGRPTTMRETVEAVAAAGGIVTP